MFEWLECEISSIKTPRFHMIDGPAGKMLQEAIMCSSLQLPFSYKEFILKFGNARLYRRVRNNSYQIGVFASPRDAVLDDGTSIRHLGFHDGASVYVKPEPYSDQLSIFESEAGSEEKVADDFGEWLTVSCAHARGTYGKEKWAEILRGPRPFTAEERKIIETRRRIQWQILGIDQSGNHIFEVVNASDRTLPVLTVGVRSRNGRLNGAIFLKIGHVGPGQKAILHVGCYKNLMPSHEIEVFGLLDPAPEDREQYGEFENI